MSSTAGEQGQQQQQQQQQKQDSPQGGNSGASSPSSSISLVRLDELSSFGATKQQRLPALIKLNPLADQQQQANSMPDFSGSQVEKTGAGAAGGKQAESLPAGLVAQGGAADKENAPDNSDDFQVVNMEEGEELEGGGNAGAAAAAAPAAGPSLPAPKSALVAESLLRGLETDSLSAQLLSTNLATGQYASHLGDSLIEMIINLRNENQNLVRALETNNEYVKERLSEFKRCQEEAKRRELQHAAEKADFEHQARKLRRQNGLLSERLKSLESKLAELNVEVGQSLEAAHSSRASSVRDASDLYPQLAGSDEESFSNAALAAAGQPRDQLATMQMDATSGELYNQGDQPAAAAAASSSTKDAQMDTTEGEGTTKRGATEALKVGAMGQEELARRFDADKSAFYALDDPMKQCDQLEQQLNDIGRRDYEICLLQQQLNIYRQDFRLERMAKLEARIQIEKLKNDIDRLCLARLQEQRGEQAGASGRVHFAAGEQQQGNLIGKLGHQLGRKAVKSAAKAAKYAAKQAHLEEKAAAALARAAAAKAAAASHFAPPRPASDLSGASSAPPAATTIAGDASGGATSDSGGRGHHQNHHHAGHHHHHFGRHHRHQRGASAGGGGRPAGLRSEVMNDLLTTANKAMLTGYKMASTHVNLALDKLSQYEQQQASQLEANSRPPIQTAAKAAAAAAAGPSAPPMEPPSID